MRTLIVDDELHARAGLRRVLDRRADIAVVGDARSAASAVTAIRELTPDVVLLDVRMTDGTGFDVLRQLDADHFPLVIFVTAYDEFATHAFDVHAIDYVLKPFKDERIHAALDRARAALEGRDYRALGQRLQALLAEVTTPPATSGARPGLSHFMVRSPEGARLVRLNEVDWIEAASYYARLHVGRHTHLIRETLNSLEERLDASAFIRVHRSAIINVDRIAQLEQGRGGRYGVVLKDGTKLPVARSRWNELNRALGV